MRHHFYRNRIVAGLLIAALSATSLSTTALADSSTFVEITDEGPLPASRTEVQKPPRRRKPLRQSAAQAHRSCRAPMP